MDGATLHHEEDGSNSAACLPELENGRAEEMADPAMALREEQCVSAPSGSAPSGSASPSPSIKHADAVEGFELGPCGEHGVTGMGEDTFRHDEDGTADETTTGGLLDGTVVSEEGASGSKAQEEKTAFNTFSTVPFTRSPSGCGTENRSQGESSEFLTLILGDDNFTFTPLFLESRHHYPSNEIVEVASSLPEDKIPNDYRPNYLALTSQGVKVHFGINPAQLRNHFFSNQYNRVVFVLPGIAYTGFPEFLDKQKDPLFKLRIHIYAFGFLKSSKNALKANALIQFLWPKQTECGKLPLPVPWHGIDIPKIGPFCEVFRSEGDDASLDAAVFHDWHPLIHNEPTPAFPSYLEDAVFYSWRTNPPLSRSPSSPPAVSATNELKETSDAADGATAGGATGGSSATTSDNRDQNLLFVPPELWNHAVDVIPHVNELFKFEMKTHDGSMAVVSKPTLKFDPRFRSDGAPAKNPFAKRGGARNARRTRGEGVRGPGAGGCFPPPPPPPPDCPPDVLLGGAPVGLGPTAGGYHQAAGPHHSVAGLHHHPHQGHPPPHHQLPPSMHPFGGGAPIFPASGGGDPRWFSTPPVAHSRGASTHRALWPTPGDLHQQQAALTGVAAAGVVGTYGAGEPLKPFLGGGVRASGKRPYGPYNHQHISQGLPDHRGAASVIGLYGDEEELEEDDPRYYEYYGGAHLPHSRPFSHQGDMFDPQDLRPHRRRRGEDDEDAQRYRELGLSSAYETGESGAPFLGVGDAHDDVLLYESLEQGAAGFYGAGGNAALSREMGAARAASSRVAGSHSDELDLLREQQYLVRLQRDRFLSAAAADPALLSDLGLEGPSCPESAIGAGGSGPAYYGRNRHAAPESNYHTGSGTSHTVDRDHGGYNTLTSSGNGGCGNTSGNGNYGESEEDAAYHHPHHRHHHSAGLVESAGTIGAAASGSSELFHSTQSPYHGHQQRMGGANAAGHLSNRDDSTSVVSGTVGGSGGLRQDPLARYAFDSFHEVGGLPTLPSSSVKQRAARVSALDAGTLRRARELHDDVRTGHQRSEGGLDVLAGEHERRHLRAEDDDRSPVQRLREPEDDLDDEPRNTHGAIGLRYHRSEASRCMPLYGSSREEQPLPNRSRSRYSPYSPVEPKGPSAGDVALGDTESVLAEVQRPHRETVVHGQSSSGHDSVMSLASEGRRNGVPPRSSPSPDSRYPQRHYREAQAYVNYDVDSQHRGSVIGGVRGTSRGPYSRASPPASPQRRYPPVARARSPSALSSSLHRGGSRGKAASGGSGRAIRDPRSGSTSYRPTPRSPEMGGGGPPHHPLHPPLITSGGGPHQSHPSHYPQSHAVPPTHHSRDPWSSESPGSAAFWKSRRRSPAGLDVGSPMQARGRRREGSSHRLSSGREGPYHHAAPSAAGLGSSGGVNSGAPLRSGSPSSPPFESGGPRGRPYRRGSPLEDAGSRYYPTPRDETSPGQFGARRVTVVNHHLSNPLAVGKRQRDRHEAPSAYRSRSRESYYGRLKRSPSWSGGGGGHRASPTAVSQHRRNN